MTTWLQETTLQGRTVTLKPLRREYREQLIEAASDGELWNLWYTSVPDADSVDDFMELALFEQAEGRALPFVVVHNDSGNVIGSTRFCNADVDHRRVEIGYTWYARRFQRTPVNTECKWLMLRHAFEQRDAIAVEFRTHWHNHASRNAIARLGAKQDGVLRNHKQMADGSYRDTVVFSIINQEWPTVKRSLSFKLDTPR